jgi:hypothetical protein
MSRSRRVLVLCIAAVCLSGGVADAHTVHHRTSLGIGRRPLGAVQPGTDVRFKGRLRSQTAACRGESVIKLVRIGVGVVATTVTGPGGRYSFNRTVRHTARWKVRFNGKVLNGTHPHNHTCRGSASRRVRVLVR